MLVTDIRMPGRSGLDLLEEIRAKRPKLPVIVMTAHSDLDSAVAAYQGGAFEYLPKPFDIDQAVDLVRRAAIADGSRRRTAAMESRRIPEMLGHAPAMQEVFRAIGRLSRSSMTVLITGESGTGKELVARALHRHSAARGEAVHRAEHVGVHGRPARVRAVRAREGRVHRGDGAAARTLRAGRRRHAVPGRDRRHVAAAADAVAARAGGGRVLSRRRAAAGQGGRAGDRGDAPGPRGARAGKGCSARTCCIA